MGSRKLQLLVEPSKGYLLCNLREAAVVVPKWRGGVRSPKDQREKIP